MTGRTLAAIAFRVWGVVLFVGALVSSAAQVAVFTMSPPIAEATFYRAIWIVTLAGPGVVGVAIVVLADRIATWIVPETPPLAIDADRFDLAAIGFGIAGIFVVVSGLQDVASIVYAALTKPDWLRGESSSSYVWGQQRVAIVRVVVEAVAGVVLILGRDGLASAWWRLRGRREEQDR
jgi:hypothetical protein